MWFQFKAETRKGSDSFDLYMSQLSRALQSTLYVDIDNMEMPKLLLEHGVEVSDDAD